MDGGDRPQLNVSRKLPDIPFPKLAAFANDALRRFEMPIGD